MSEAAYDVLRRQVESGQLEVVHLVAPPRSSSTALERSLGNSPSVDTQINDPWSIYDANREEQTYDYILSRVSEVPAPSNRPTSVVIKDIADYIPPGNAWDRMTALARHTIFLVRQPLLTLESMMRIMAHEVSEADGNAYAESMGYASWPAMQEIVGRERDYRPYDGLYRRLFREEQPIHELPEMQVPVLMFAPKRFIHDLGYDTHDDYAVAKGYASWADLCQRLQSDGTEASVLAACGDLLDANFQCRITGWTALRQHFDRMQDGRSYDVVDATMFRALPQLFLSDMFERAKLDFSPQTVDWKTSDKVFNSDYEGEVPYYDKVIQSVGITPPDETSIQPDRFPAFIQDTLFGEEGVLDTYEHILGRVLGRLSAERKAELCAVRVDGKPISEIDPIFYGIINRKD